MLLIVERIVALLQLCLRLALGGVQQALDALLRATQIPYLGGGFGAGLFGITTWIAFIHVWPVFFLKTPDGLRLQDRLREADRMHLAPTLYDATGTFVSALDFSAFHNGESIAANQSYFGRVEQDGRPKTKLASTVFVARANADYIACLRLLEDSRDQHPLLNPYGVELLFPVAAARRLVSGGGLTGGSTLVAQYQQQIGFHKTDQRMGPYRRKFEEFFHRTPAMAAVVDYNLANSAQFAARTMPHFAGIGGEGGNVRGIALAARIVFGVEPDRLSQAQAYYLAGTTISPPKMRYQLAGDPARPVARAFSGNDDAQALQDKWNKAAGPARAGKCVDRLADSDQRERLHGELRAITASDKAARPSPLVERLGLDAFAQEPDPAAAWGRAAQNPFEHAGVLLPDVVGAVGSELKDAFDNRWNGTVSRIALSLELEPQYAFHRTFDRTVRGWLQETDAEGLLNPLYRDWVNGGACVTTADQACPSVIAAISDADGRIVRYYSSQPRSSLYYGSNRERDPEAGSTIRPGYRWDQEVLQVASVGKVGAALLFARMKVDPRGLIDMMARSSTDRVIAALTTALGDARRKARQAGQPVPQHAEEVAALLHWSGQSIAGQSGGGVDGQAAAYSKGTYAASPRTVHHNMSVLLNGFMGRRGPVKAPTMIGQVGYLDYYHRRLGPSAPRLPDYLADDYSEPSGDGLNGVAQRNYLRVLRDPARREGVSADIRAAIASPHSGSDPDVLVPREDRATVYALLNAPFCWPGGTLRAVGATWCGRTRLLFGKTGTHDITDYYKQVQRDERKRVPPVTKGVVNSLWAVGGLQFPDNRGYSFVVLVSGGSSLKQPLFVPQRAGARDIEASSLARLLSAMLTDIAGEAAFDQQTEGKRQ